MNNFNLIVTISDTPFKKNLNILMDSIERNIGFLSKVIFIIEESCYNFVEKQIDIISHTSKNVDIYFIIDYQQTSKLEKLLLASKIVSDESFIITLDEDDELINLSKMHSDRYLFGDKDLILTNLTMNLGDSDEFCIFDPEIDH